MKKPYLIASAIVLLGMVVFSYPLISAIVNERVAAKAVSRYSNAVVSADNARVETEREEAVSYNQTLPRNTGLIHEAGFTAGSGTDSAYENAMSLSGNGVMATITIPKITLTLPIYHYCTEMQLENGVGHIYGTSLPIGGEGHCVLTGHRGLPSAELFTRLDEIGISDLVQISSLGETLVYRIYSIQTVLPKDVEDIRIEPGKDLLTLVTCTPYGVNTHRLVITARREIIPEDTAKEMAAAAANTPAIPQKERWRIPILLLLVIAWLTIGAFLKYRHILNMDFEATEESVERLAAESRARAKRILFVLGGILLFSAGLFMLLYPKYKDRKNKERILTEFAAYRAEAAADPDDARFAAYEAYNESKTTEAYTACGVFLGYVSVPSISLLQPVSLGTDEETLEKGAGHLYGTDLPGCGENTNCVLCGHNGLVGKELFANLEQVKVGDTVSLTVGSKEFSYTVVSTETIAEDASAYRVFPGEEILTLSTCTPVGVNSHRFMVYCKRNKD